jgi:hypothetical protein
MGPELDPRATFHVIEVVDLHETAALLIHRVKGAVQVENLDAVHARVEDAATEVFARLRTNSAAMRLRLRFRDAVVGPSPRCKHQSVLRAHPGSLDS